MAAHADAAVKMFEGKCNCAQSVLYSYSKDLKFDPDLAVTIASGFGGGMGRKQEVCGAVTGGIMVLGLVHGKGKEDDGNRKEKIYSEVRAFIDAFVEVHGSVCCKDLLGGCSLIAKEGRERFIAEKLIEKCQEYVRTACDILDAQI